MKLIQFEVNVLRALAGIEVPGMAWGAAMSVAMETLANHHLIIVDGSQFGTVTAKGREYLAKRGYCQ